MRRSQALLLSLLLLALCPGAWAQPNRYGVPLINNYPFDITGGDQQNWAVTQDSRGLIYVGNQAKGVLEYDGVEWRSIPVPNNTRVQSLVSGEDGMVYVGCMGDFGVLRPDDRGLLTYHSLCDSAYKAAYPEFDTWKVFYVNDQVYFSAGENDVIYDTRTDSTTYIQKPLSFSISYLKGGMHLNSSWDQGLQVYEKGSFKPLPGGRFFRHKTVLGLEVFGPRVLLVSTYQSGIYLYNYDTGSVKDFVEPELMELFSDANVPFMDITHNQQVLVGTQYDKGLFILDKSGQVQDVISEAEGLLEETIAQAYMNAKTQRDEPIWIAHWRGVSKVETNSPLRFFSERSGFKGLINDLAYFGDKLFISTMEGVFYLQSSPTGTQFIMLDEIQEEIWDLMVLRPSGRREFLLASANKEVFVIDLNQNVSLLSEIIEKDNVDRNILEQFGGQRMVQDMPKKQTFYMGFDQVLAVSYQRGRWYLDDFAPKIEEEILEMMTDIYGYLWISTNQSIFRLDMSLPNDTLFRTYGNAQGLPQDEGNTVLQNIRTGEVLMGSRDGFYSFDYLEERFYADSTLNSVLPAGSNAISSLHVDAEGDYWISFENSELGSSLIVARPESDGMKVVFDDIFSRLPRASVDDFMDDGARGVWFSKGFELYHYDKGYEREASIHFQTLIRKVSIAERDSALFLGTNHQKDRLGRRMIQLHQGDEAQPVIKYRYNDIEFQWAAPFFEKENNTQYSYHLEGFSKGWSEWTSTTSKEFTNLKYGKYLLMVKAKNVYGVESEAATYAFSITRPWYAHFLAYFGYIILAGFLVYVITRLYTQRLKNENIRLEGIIGERTAEIRKQKEELTDSIEYASRIQQALLPSNRLMEEQNLEHFILFRPRDIVSGDFYWMGMKNNKLLIVAADCTGHGVPGAFMSMLGMTFLDEIVIKSEITNTETILDSLREHVITALESADQPIGDVVKDGMDLAMVSLDLEEGLIQYSGAYNPLYLVRKLKRSEKAKLNRGQELDLPRGSIYDEEHLLLQIRADQMPIGNSEKTMPFTSSCLKDEGYTIYMFSDGYLDQFGGPKGKKYMSRNFKKLLLDLQDTPLPEQGGALEAELLNWMGDISQIDDILVMGIRMNPT